MAEWEDGLKRHGCMGIYIQSYGINLEIFPTPEGDFVIGDFHCNDDLYSASFTGVTVAGPFPTLDVAKVAYIMICSTRGKDYTL